MTKTFRNLRLPETCCTGGCGSVTITPQPPIFHFFIPPCNLTWISCCFSLLAGTQKSRFEYPFGHCSFVDSFMAIACFLFRCQAFLESAGPFSLRFLRIRLFIWEYMASFLRWPRALLLTCPLNPPLFIRPLLGVIVDTMFFAVPPLADFFLPEPNWNSTCRPNKGAVVFFKKVASLGNALFAFFPRLFRFFAPKSKPI